MSASSNRKVNLSLNGAKVTEGFRDQIFDASNRAGISPNEFALVAAAEKLLASGRKFDGVFSAGDLSEFMTGPRT